jgi:two-component system NarL family response regulator
VLITFLASEMVLMISDDGSGFNPLTAPGAPDGHFGLSIMRERTEQMGGRLEIRSEPKQGTQLLITIPQARAAKTKANDLADIHELRILLVDDQPLFLDGLRNLCIARGLTIIGLARDGLEAQEQVRVLRPDVVIMDIQMPNCDGLEATRRIKAEFPEVIVVLLTISQTNEHLVNAIRYGASGYLLKSLDANELFSMLAAIARGEMQIAPQLASHLLTELTHSAPRQSDKAASTGEFNPLALTARQWDVLRLVGRRMTYKEVGTILHLTERAVKYHMAQILERLHLADRDQAVEYVQNLEEMQKKKTVSGNN